MLLIYEGEFQANLFDPDDKLYGCLFSWVSVPVVIGRLKAIVEKVLEFGPDSVPPVP